MKPVYCPKSGTRLFDVHESLDVKVAEKSETMARKADMELKCKCSAIITVRFPRNANTDINLARGIRQH